MRWRIIRVSVPQDLPGLDRVFHVVVSEYLAGKRLFENRSRTDALEAQQRGMNGIGLPKSFKETE